MNSHLRRVLRFIARLATEEHVMKSSWGGFLLYVKFDYSMLRFVKIISRPWVLTLREFNPRACQDLSARVLREFLYWPWRCISFRQTLTVCASVFLALLLAKWGKQACCDLTVSWSYQRLPWQLKNRVLGNTRADDFPLAWYDRSRWAIPSFHKSPAAWHHVTNLHE